MSKSGKHIKNIEYPYSTKWDKRNDVVTFDLDDSNYTLMNTIRRTIISGVRTVGFRSEPYEKCDIKIFQNDTPLHNQIMTHRIAMIPINIPNFNKINIDDFEFIIDVDNNTNFTKDITSKDFKVRIISDDKFLSEQETNKIFPPDPISGDYVLITRLKPKYYAFSNVKDTHLSSSLRNELTNNNSENMRFYMKAKASISSGFENGHYNPTTCAAYQNRVDPDRVEKEKADFIESQKEFHIANNLTVPSIDSLERKFMTSQYKRCFYTNEEGEPYRFTWKIESIGVIPPLITFHRSLDILKDKLDIFRTNMIQGNTNEINISPSSELENAFDVLILNENETLGNLLQTYITKLYGDYSDVNRKVNYIGCNRPHPSEESILIVIQPTEKMDWERIIDTIIMPTCAYVSKEFDGLMKELDHIPQYVSEIKKIK